MRINVVTGCEYMVTVLSFVVFLLDKYIPLSLCVGTVLYLAVGQFAYVYTVYVRHEKSKRASVAQKLITVVWYTLLYDFATLVVKLFSVSLFSFFIVNSTRQRSKGNHVQ